MAYMNQERKAKLAANVKAVMPKGWKYTVAVRNHSTIVLTIQSAPVDLIGEMIRVGNAGRAANGFAEWTARPHADVNVYHLDGQFDESLATFEQIKAALNDGNHNRSDLQSDYHDVGWYVDINVGRWDKPFVNTAAEAVAA